MRMHCTMAFATLVAIGMSPMFAQAQQTLPNRSPDRQDLSGHASGAQGATNSANQAGSTQPGTPERGTNQLGSDRLGTSRLGQTEQLGQQSSQDELATFFAAKMVIGQQAEMQAISMASDKLEHPQVKEFAQKLMQDHQQLQQRIMQAMPHLASVEGVRSQQTASQQSSSLHDSRSSLQGTQQGQIGTSGQAAAGQSPSNSGIAQQQSDRNTSPSDPSDRIAASDSPSRSTTPGSVDSDLENDRSTASPHSTAYRGEPGRQALSGSLNKLVAICRESAENDLQMSRQMMESKAEGKDMDMTFVGSQIICHQKALAELRALDGVGSSEFQQIVQQAEQVMERHYQEAQELAMTLGSESGNPSSQRDSDTRSSIDRR